MFRILSLTTLLLADVEEACCISSGVSYLTVRTLRADVSESEVLEELSNSIGLFLLYTLTAEVDGTGLWTATTASVSAKNNT